MCDMWHVTLVQDDHGSLIISSVKRASSNALAPAPAPAPALQLPQLPDVQASQQPN